jgi:prepilin-type N-terminal cleavage/methylation domain-containing protein
MTRRNSLLAHLSTNTAVHTHRASSKRHGRRRLRRGFSIVELAVVLIMIGILATLVLPKVRLGSSVVDTSARTIGMAFMVAQREAVSRQHNVLVVFDTTYNAARTIWDANNNRVADAGEKSRPFLLPEGLVIGRPPGVPELDGVAETPGVSNAPEGPMVVLQRSGGADRVAVLYLTTVKALAGGDDVDARALYIVRATGRPVWYAWTGSVWRRHG